MTCNVAFIGLGVMGYPMAGYISKGGHNVTVFNRTQSKADKWIKEFKGEKADTPAKAAAGADFIFTCVGNDNDLREVTFGDNGIFKTIKDGSVYIDNTTASATIAREIYDYSKKNNFGFLDAPVSGGQAGAENGVLSIMCGGDETDYARVEPILEVYSKICRRIGVSGAGQKTKMCNQIAIAGLVQGLSEALHFAEKSGLDGRAVVEVISQGAAGSWQMSNRFETMLNDEFEHGFAVDWMRKDLKICLDAGDTNGASLPITAMVDQFYKDVQKMGGGRWDTSSLFKRLKVIDGLK